MKSNFMLYYHRERNPQLIRIAMEEADDAKTAREQFMSRDNVQPMRVLGGAATIVKDEKL